MGVPPIKAKKYLKKKEETVVKKYVKFISHERGTKEENYIIAYKTNSTTVRNNALCLESFGFAQEKIISLGLQ